MFGVTLGCLQCCEGATNDSISSFTFSNNLNTFWMLSVSSIILRFRLLFTVTIKSSLLLVANTVTEALCTVYSNCQFLAVFSRPMLVATSAHSPSLRFEL